METPHTTIDFGSQRFDLAILGHIVHLIGERSTRNLLSKLHRALKHGGRVAILDIVPNKERTGPTFPVLFALLMLLRTKDGGTYTVTECSDWLKTAGFHCIEIVEDVSYYSPVSSKQVALEAFRLPPWPNVKVTASF